LSLNTYIVVFDVNGQDFNIELKAASKSDARTKARKMADQYWPSSVLKDAFRPILFDTSSAK
jgi:hypothetical protein